MTVSQPLLVAVASVVTFLLVATGCETAPPIQEMSDARQAIAVARGAGAATVAASELDAAERSLKSAELRLEERNYEQARRDALIAHDRAKAALVRTEIDSRVP